MARPEDKTQRLDSIVVGQRDIVFECPSCGKSLVVDEAAQGLIVDCPQCRINVIVPPKTAAAATQPAQQRPETASKTPPPAEPKPAAELIALKERLIALGNQLRELQTQRTEINTRLASRVNEINRDLVLSARLETSHQQMMSEWQQLVSQIGASSPKTATAAPGAPAGRSRVQFGH